MSEYKPGDRVRVAYEGVVLNPPHIFRTDGKPFYVDLESAVSIEKLAPPEPKWVYGAVVKTPGYRPLVWDGEQWRASSGRPWALSDDVSFSWKNGTLQVLWNEDTDE